MTFEGPDDVAGALAKSLLHEVTQCMSALTSTFGSSFHSSQVNCRGFSTRPETLKVQISALNFGVRP